MVIGPLRERLSVAIDSGDAGDTGGLVERIGARYREWKNQSLERSLGEVLASAWTRGVYDAVPDEAVLWWIPFEEGRCSDCDDNALEPTVKGKQFPTGQALPPAHPGCKCLLVPAGLLEGSLAEHAKRSNADTDYARSWSVAIDLLSAGCELRRSRAVDVRSACGPG